MQKLFSLKTRKLSYRKDDHAMRLLSCNRLLESGIWWKF